MEAKSKKKYEQYLNQFYSEFYTVEQTINDFIYLTVKSRAGGHCSKNKLIAAHHSQKLGSILRKYDSIAFTVGYNEWKFK